MIAAINMLRNPSGSITFHPNAIKRSYLKRGQVARTQIKMKITIMVLMNRYIGPSQGRRSMNGPRYPPRKRVEAIMLMAMILMYSAM